MYGTRSISDAVVGICLVSNRAHRAWTTDPESVCQEKLPVDFRMISTAKNQKPKPEAPKILNLKKIHHYKNYCALFQLEECGPRSYS